MHCKNETMDSFEFYYVVCSTYIHAPKDLTINVIQESKMEEPRASWRSLTILPKSRRRGRGTTVGGRWWTRGSRSGSNRSRFVGSMRT